MITKYTIRSMGPVKRKVTYRLYPTGTQARALLALLGAHQRLYNAALEHRRYAWKRARVSVSFADQCREVTELRAADPEYAELNAQSLQVTLKRVALAFQAFFRRAEARGGKAGFPRFKPLARFAGWGYKNHGDGWRVLPGNGCKHGRLRLSSVGLVRIRGKARTPGTPKTCEILHKGEHWYASVTLICEPERKGGTEELGFDWGVESFVTLSTGARVENPRFVRSSEARVRALQQNLARKRRGSRNRARARRHLAHELGRIANRRRDFLQQESARLVARARLLATEKLEVKKMTRSAKGSVENPGTGVRQKAGLNRSILDGAPAAFLAMVRYKAVEAGIGYLEVPTREIAPSQTCPGCGRRKRKEIAERVHACPCGAVMSRDQAAAQVCLEYALKRVGNRPGVEGGLAPPLKHETHAIAAQAAWRE